MTDPGRATPYEASYRLLARGVDVDAAIMARPGILAGHESSPSRIPIFAERARGAYVYDVDGRRYVDLLLAFGAVVLGHADDDVDEAVISEIRRGTSRTLHSGHQVRLAELIREVVPGAEMATFLRTGSDATAAAVRIARARTNRRHVLRWGYNGWHDWCAPRAAGIVPEARACSSTFAYNDLQAVEEAIAARRDDLAAVLMMPIEVELPMPGYLQEVARLAHRDGALFILDEVRSGFRLSLGGAQQFFGVEADLVVFSKAMANGYCISAVAGPAAIMRTVADISLSSVFFRSSDGMAAAIATLEKLRTTNSIQTLWCLGRRLQEGLKAAAARAGVQAQATGVPPMPFLRFDGDDAWQTLAMRTFSSVMLDRGVLLHPNHHWFVCASMTEQDIDCVLGHACAAFGAVAALPR